MKPRAKQNIKFSGTTMSVKIFSASNEISYKNHLPLDYF